MKTHLVNEQNNILYLNNALLLLRQENALVPVTSVMEVSEIVKAINDCIHYAEFDIFNDGDKIHFKDKTFIVRKGIVASSPSIETIESIQMHDIVGDYDVPDTVPEWQWIENNASFSHRSNGQHGVWDFILNLSLTFGDVPAKLAPVIEKAKVEKKSYLLFHQGT